MKKIMVIVILVVFVGAAIAGYMYSQRDKVASKMLESYLGEVMGSEVVVTDLVSANKGDRVRVGLIQIMNPPGFGQSGVLAEISDVSWTWKFRDYLKSKRAHFSRIEASLQKVNVYVSEKGGLNLREMNSVSDHVLSYKKSSVEKASPKFFVDRVELHYGEVELHEFRALKPFSSRVKFSEKKDILGNVSDIHVLVQLPLIKILSSLNRGSMGVPRTLLQQSIANNTGKPLASRGT